jgi:hypothetical protein
MSGGTYLICGRCDRRERFRNVAAARSQGWLFDIADPLTPDNIFLIRCPACMQATAGDTREEGR